MKRLFLLVIISNFAFFLIACNSNDKDQPITIDDNLNIELMSIGGPGKNYLLDYCQTGDYSYSVLLAVEIEENVFENRLYDFVDKTILDNVSIIISDTINCTDEYLIENNSNNRLYFENSYFVKINEYDVFDEDLIVVQQYDFSDKLISSYTFSELEDDIYELLDYDLIFQLDNRYSILINIGIEAWIYDNVSNSTKQFSNGLSWRDDFIIHFSDGSFIYHARSSAAQNLSLALNYDTTIIIDNNEVNTKTHNSLILYIELND